MLRFWELRGGLLSSNKVMLFVFIVLWNLCHKILKTGIAIMLASLLKRANRKWHVWVLAFHISPALAPDLTSLITWLTQPKKGVNCPLWGSVLCIPVSGISAFVLWFSQWTPDFCEICEQMLTILLTILPEPQISFWKCFVKQSL